MTSTRRPTPGGKLKEMLKNQMTRSTISAPLAVAQLGPLNWRTGSAVLTILEGL